MNILLRGALSRRLAWLMGTVVAICATGGQAGAAGLVLSQTFLNFIAANVGQQAMAQTLIASNTGAAEIPISISIVNPSPVQPGAQFLQTNTCGAILAAGASCAVSINFTPARVGNAGATLSFGAGNPGAFLSGLAKALNNSNVIITVDQPANNAAVSGKIKASGWAIANNDGVANVTYSLDTPQNFYNSVNYGYLRGDVCQAYPGRFGCPYVGWQFDLDTTAMSNGPHVLYIKTTTQTSVSKVIGSPFTVSNQVSGNTPLLQVDQPIAGATLSGNVSLYGWAIGTGSYSLSPVRILMDGATVTSVSVSQQRLDVCVIYPNRPLCPNVGWSYVLDTTQFPDGPHTLSFLAPIAPPGSSSNSSVSVPVTIANFAASQSNPMRLVIDSPAAKMGSLSGTATVNGWAIADDAAIDSVIVSVDGKSLGTATYGISRLDVCVAYPDRAGCPNVGWNYALDTTLWADGAHLLEVTARSANGKYGTVQSQFTISNAGANSDFHVHIDVPIAGGALSGTPMLSGWAVNDSAAVGLITISVDGVPQGFTIETLARPDVCASYPGRANCPIVGWRYFFNSLVLTDGTHTLDVTVNAGLRHATFGTTFATSNLAPTDSTLLYVDQPTASSGPLSGTATVTGWAVDDRGNVNSSVQISVDGTTIGTATYGMPRPDVCAVYPGRVACPNVGWSYLLDTAMLPDGPHTLTLTVSGTTKQSVSTNINVINGNSTVPKMKVYIDQPGSGSPILQGTAHMSGWAISTVPSTSLLYVGLYIDDLQPGFVFYGLTPRADVCSIFTSATGCPNVGWSVDMDTTQFVDGPHVLRVTASNNAGNIAFASVPIVIGNSVILNPMHLTIDGSATSNLSGTANLWGWAVSDDASISTISVSVDGAALGNASYGDSRKDVCDIYENRLGCPNVGWHLAVDTTKLSNGSHSLSVMATSSLGEQATQTATVTVKN